LESGIADAIGDAIFFRRARVVNIQPLGVAAKFLLFFLVG